MAQRKKSGFRKTARMPGSQQQNVDDPAMVYQHVRIDPNLAEPLAERPDPEGEVERIRRSLRGSVLSYDNPFEPVAVDDYDALQ